MTIKIDSITDAEFVDLQLFLFGKGYLWASQSEPNVIAYPTYSFNNEEVRTRSNGIVFDEKTGKMYFTNVWTDIEKSYPNQKIVNFKDVLSNDTCTV